MIYLAIIISAVLYRVPRGGPNNRGADETPTAELNLVGCGL